MIQWKKKPKTETTDTSVHTIWESVDDLYQVINRTPTLGQDSADHYAADWVACVVTSTRRVLKTGLRTKEKAIEVCEEYEKKSQGEQAPEAKPRRTKRQ